MPKDTIPQFIPPLTGGGDWLSFSPCPFPGRADVGPWFSRLAGLTSEEVREVLRSDWRLITHPVVRRFAEKLLLYRPFGMLKSDHRDGLADTWLVFSYLPPATGLAERVRECGAEGFVFCLPAPPSVPAGVDTDSDILAAHFRYRGFGPEESLKAGWHSELVFTFFKFFGGLRLSPPFILGQFFDFPTGPLRSDEESDDPRKAAWRDAVTVFLGDTGDELLVDRNEECGWLDYHTRDIVPVGDFAHVLDSLLRQNCLAFD